MTTWGLCVRCVSSLPVAMPFSSRPPLQAKDMFYSVPVCPGCGLTSTNGPHDLCDKCKYSPPGPVVTATVRPVAAPEISIFTTSSGVLAGSMNPAICFGYVRLVTFKGVMVEYSPSVSSSGSNKPVIQESTTQTACASFVAASPCQT